MTAFPLTKPPLTIPGLKLWLDANDPAGNGSQPANDSALATWVDKSGNKNDAGNATGSQQPLFKTNILAGLPSVRFDGVDDFFSTPNTLTTTDFTLIEVKKVLTYDDGRGIYYYGGAGQGFYSNNDGTGNGVYFFTPTAIVPNASQSSDFIIQGHRKVGTSGQLYKNGILNSTDPVNAAAQSARLYIGADTAGAAAGNTDYCEILFYNYALSDAHFAYITTYLNNKWGIA